MDMVPYHRKHQENNERGVAFLLVKDAKQIQSNYSVRLQNLPKSSLSLSSTHLKLTTLLTSQSLISPLKYLALKNIFSIFTTLLTSHLLISPLKVVAWNILLIFSTLLTSQSEIFSLKGIIPESPYLYTNNWDMSVIWEVHHEFMG